MPTRAADGSWIPAAYMPGQQKTPALASTGVSVAGEGLEPSTSRFEATWLRLALERAEMELYWGVARVRKSLQAQIITAACSHLARPRHRTDRLTPLLFTPNTSKRAVGTNALNTGIAANTGHASHLLKRDRYGATLLENDAAYIPLAGSF